MKTTPILAAAFLTFACMLGCDADEGPSDSIESVEQTEMPITEVDAAYIQAHADANGTVSLDFGAEATNSYHVDVDVLDDVVLTSEQGSIPAREWLELANLDNYTAADSIILASPNVADSLDQNDGFRHILICVFVGPAGICVLIPD